MREKVNKETRRKEIWKRERKSEGMIIKLGKQRKSRKLQDFHRD